MESSPVSEVGLGSVVPSRLLRVALGLAPRAVPPCEHLYPCGQFGNVSGKFSSSSRGPSQFLGYWEARTL